MTKKIALGLAVLLSLTGCGTTARSLPGPTRALRLPGLLGSRAEEDALREAVENDPFPAASQTGLRPQL